MKALEIIVEFINYKLFKKKKFELTGSWLYVVNGSNKKGKSTFLNALIALMRAKDDTPIPVTEGEEKGSYKGFLPAKDGRKFQVINEFDNDKMKFKMINPEGHVIGKVGDIRDTFNYHHITADQLLEMSKTAKGRREMREYLLGLLPATTRQDYKALTSKEELSYEERTKYNLQVDNFKGLMNEYELNDEEKELVELKEDATELMEELQEELEKFGDTDSINNKIIELEESKVTVKAQVDNAIQLIDDAITGYNSDIADLEKRLEDAKKKKEDAIAKKEKVNEDYMKVIEPIDEQITELKEKVSEENNGDDLEELKERISNGKEKMVSIDAAINKKVQYDAYEKKYKENKDHADKINSDIESYREKKKKIISDAKFPVNIDMVGEKITIDGLDFTSEQICKSDAMKVLTAIMCKINEAPIQIVGSANDLDWDSLDEIAKIAEEHGKVLFLDHHEKMPTDIEVIGLEQFKEIHMSVNKETKVDKKAKSKSTGKKKEEKKKEEPVKTEEKKTSKKPKKNLF